MRAIRPLLVVVIAVAGAGCTRSTPAAPIRAEAVAARVASGLPPPDAARLLTGTPEAFSAACSASLDLARRQLAAVKQLKADGDAGEPLLLAYDRAAGELSNAASRSSLAREVHPDAKMREAARDCEQQVELLNVEFAQDRGLYDALASVELKDADPATRFWMDRTLLDFRRAGVDRDEATRERVKALNEELVKLGQAFGKNISGDVREVRLGVKELAGLPEDYLKAHPADAAGKVAITSNYPDYIPFLAYARDGKAREKVWRMYRQRAHPQNIEVLAALIEKRHELATLLGYASWAAYTTETKMTRTQEDAGAFIQKIGDLSDARAKREYQALLARKQKDSPKARTLEPWDQDFYENLYKSEAFGFDSQAIRPWLEYGRVKQGVMEVTAEIFGITYRPVEDAPVWHPDVEGYDVLEGGELLGRVYLDMHPREDKYKHAAQFDLVTGQADRFFPEGVLVCNFPRPGELMTHGEVETFFHEFGHLLHHIFAGKEKWAGIAGIRTEWDFVETPSMLLQQWASQPEVLGRFARHVETGEPLPEEMVRKLRASREFGKGLWSRRQAFLAAVSLEYYRRPPGFDATRVLVELQEKFAPFRQEHRDGTWFQLSFGHLNGYSAAYYTYLWSLVIAKDLETEFQKNGFLDPATANRYRRAVLEPGGSRPAAVLVNDFLGRDYGFESYRAFLEAEPD